MIGGGCAGQNEAEIGERQHSWCGYFVCFFGDLWLIDGVRCLGFDGQLALSPMMVVDCLNSQGKPSTAVVEGWLMQLSFLLTLFPFFQFFLKLNGKI